MQFISVRDFRNSSAKIWRDLPNEREMVITNNGKPIALLMPITGSDLEESLSAIRQAKALMSLKQVQQQSIEKGTDKISLKEINAVISETRKSKP